MIILLGLVMNPLIQTHFGFGTEPEPEADDTFVLWFGIWVQPRRTDCHPQFSLSRTKTYSILELINCCRPCKLMVAAHINEEGPLSGA